jgi:hypothetical protein
MLFTAALGVLFRHDGHDPQGRMPDQVRHPDE